MEKTEGMVLLHADRYEKLVADAEKLEIIKRAYKTVRGYVYDDILKMLFGEKEETGKC